MPDRQPSIEGVQVAEIAGFTKHGINRVIDRGIPPDDIPDALNNPKIIDIRPDSSIRYRGANATVVVNPITKMDITVYGKKN